MNSKTRFFSLCLTAIAAVAFGQTTIAPRAAVLIEAARVAHGKTALGSLRGVTATLELTLYNNGTAMQSQTQTLLVDVIGNRARTDVTVGTKRILSLVVDGSGARNWTPQSGISTLNAATVEGLKQQLISSFPIFALAIPWSGATTDGAATWQGVAGEAITATRAGINLGLLFGTNGLLVAERLAGPRGDIFALLEDVRTVSGLQVPYKVRLFQAGVLTSQAVLMSVSINPSFVAADFTLP